MPPLAAPTRRYALALAGALPVLLLANDHGAQLMPVTGPSMSPALSPDYDATRRRDTVLVRLWAPHRAVPRGAIVVFWSPTNPATMIVKRVVGLPGDEVRTRAPYPAPTAVVPAGSVWVEGDNPEARKTQDSNTYGPIPLGLVAGRVTAVVWPWRRARWMRSGEWRMPGEDRVVVGKHEVKSGLEEG